MLSIRLSRVGKKKQPSYRIIVLDKRKDPWGKYLENLGFYNPRVKPRKIELKEERIKYWLSVGAGPSATVHNLLVDAKIIEGPKKKATIIRKKKKVEEKKEAAPKAPSASPETPEQPAAEIPAEKPAEKPAPTPEEIPEAPVEQTPVEPPKEEVEEYPKAG